MSLSTDKSNHDDLMGKENAAISQLTSKKEALATASQQDAKVRGTREKELSRAQKDVDSVAMFLEEKKAEHAYVVTPLCSVYRDPTPDRKQTRVLLLLLLLLRWMAREVLTQITLENGRLREDLIGWR